MTLEVYALYDQDFIVLYPLHPRYAIPRHKTLDIEIISTFNVRFIMESPIERYFPDCYVVHSTLTSLRNEVYCDSKHP